MVVQHRKDIICEMNNIKQGERNKSVEVLYTIEVKLLAQTIITKRYLL